MSKDLNFDTSLPQKKTNSQNENSLENLIEMHNSSSSETKSTGSNDKSETDSYSTPSRCSTPNELERTFNQAYDPEKCNLLEVGNSSLADTEANVKNITKPLDVARKPTDAEFPESKPSQKSDWVQKLDSWSSIKRSPKKGSKVEVRKEIKRLSVPLKRENSEELIFQFDEDLNQETEQDPERNLNLAMNAAANYVPDRKLERIYEVIFSRLRQLNELLMAVECLRKYMANLREPLGHTDNFRKCSLDSLLKEQSNVKFQFDNLSKEVKLAFNLTISNCEHFIRKSLKFFKAFRQRSQEFCKDYACEYFEQMCGLRSQLAVTKYVMLNNRGDRTLRTCILQMFNLITNCDASFVVECGVMRRICS